MRIKRPTDVRPNGPPPRLGLKASSPGAGADEDCNSNTSLAGSQHSAHDAAVDCDSQYDNSDYLWFLDYNPLFRDGSCHHTSVLSSVSASYKGISDLTSRFEFTSRYNDLARDLDANLAEVDMESFKTEDIHALLMTADMPHDTIIHHDDRNHDGDESTAGSINTMSICKSELLFSPVKEATHGVHFSIDSLDCELPTEQDLILTCQANKDNYTIAFEGSVTNYSEDSECVETAVTNRNDNKKEKKNDNVNNVINEERTRRNLELLEKCHKLTNNLTSSMARSEQGLTTWSKLKKQTSQSPLRRHPSGNNNENSHETSNETSEVSGSVIKSQSLPNLFKSRKLLSSSMHSTALSNSTVDSFTTHQRLSGAGTCMKVYDIAHNITRSHGSQHSEPMSTSSTENPSSSDKSQPKQSFNLVKLFMKQKSMSNEGIVSMEQLEECWPSSSGGESDSFGESKTKHIRKMEKLPMNMSDDGGQDETDFINPTEYTGYETNILTTTQTLCNRGYDEALIEEDEDTTNENKLCDSESNLYATVNKPARRNVNNNNVTHSPLRLRTPSRRSCSSQSSATSVSISSCSESDGTQLTKMHRLIHKDHYDNKATSTQARVDMIDRSMQTSSMGISYACPERDNIKVVEPSFLEKLKEGDCEKPVFILYPNYTLPDISFLNGRPNIYLTPQKITLSQNGNEKKKEGKGKRPFSCNDVELLRKKGFSHIKDWDSLSFLLPTECKQMLSEVPEIMQKFTKESPQKYSSPAGKTKCRPMSCDCNMMTNHPTNVSSSSSTATQPSSGYRGSSTMLTDSSAQNSPAPGNLNPLFVYRYDSATSSEASYVHDKVNPVVPKRSLSIADQHKIGKGTELAPPRPPLPKGILRKSMDKQRKGGNAKRYSMFEMEEFFPDPITCMTAITEQKITKRRSLQEPYYLQKQHSLKNNDLAAKRLSQQFLDAADKDAEYNEYYHDEGVGTESSLDSGKSNDVKYHRPHTPPLPKPRTKKMEYTEFPPPGALISSSDLQQLEEFLKQSGFSCHNMDEWDQIQVQKGKNLAEIPICEEGEVSPDEYGSPKHELNATRCGSIDVSQKRALVSSVTDAVEMLIQHFSTATDQTELGVLGDSEQSPACAKIALNALCPALYAIFTDGLRESIETSFGAVNNSVWQMVEATARQGPITKSLNELVLRINSEDAVTEGLVKFNAFVLGLLNAQSVDSWVSYIRTRESDLRKHYTPDSLLRAGCAGEPGCRAMLDTLLASLEPLRLLPFRLDLMFEMRELHRSFKRLESEMRAASRLASSGEDTWAASGDSRPPSGAANQTNGGKFRRLQIKWELLSNGDSPPNTPPGTGETSPAGSRGSRIPRPVTSPVRPPTSAVTSPAKATHRGIPVPVRKGSSPTTPRPPAAAPRAPCTPPRPALTSTPVKRQSLPPSRASRVDHPTGATPRPSSLPYGRTAASAASGKRRAASSSLNRTNNSPTCSAKKTCNKPKMVRTLWHRLPSDSGHLAFNEGERLRLVLEVDDQYLLCCRGDQKGLVPRNAVILENSLNKL